MSGSLMLLATRASARSRLAVCSRTTLQSSLVLWWPQHQPPVGVRYDEATNPSEMRAINQKLRKAIESEGRVERIEGLWWQFSLTVRGPQEPSA